MSQFETARIQGVIQDVFAHRFTVRGDERVYLADLTPKGLTAFPILEGLDVVVEGEVRPSEIKVTRISAEGRPAVSIEHKKPHHAPGHVHAERQADPALVLSMLRAGNWVIDREPKRKPKHFEILAHRDGGEPEELHVDFAGVVYKRKSADFAKWNVGSP